MAAEVAVLMLHPGCNMVCDFCITEDAMHSKTYDEALRLLGEFRSRGISNVVIGGGEPFIWPHDLLALTREAKRLGFFVQVGTNTINVPEGFETIESIDRYVIPLESVAPGPHNQMRKYRRQHHELIMSRLAKLKEAQKPVTVSTVVTKVNEHEVLKVGEFLREYHEGSAHVHAWHLYQFVPLGRGGEKHASELQLSIETFERIFAGTKALVLPFKVFKRVNMYQSKAVAFY